MQVYIEPYAISADKIIARKRKHSLFIRNLFSSQFDLFSSRS